LAVRAEQRLIQGVLEPAMREAEARLALRLSLVPPDHAGLVAKVSSRVDAERVLAADTLLRRNPHWRDPALWSFSDTWRYVAHALASEVKLVALKERMRLAKEKAERGRSEARRRERKGRGIRGMTPGSPTERTVQRREAAERCKQQLDHLMDRFNAPPGLRRARALMAKHHLPSIAKALKLAGVKRDVFENWVDRVQRGLNKEFASSAPKSGGRRSV